MTGVAQASALEGVAATVHRVAALAAGGLPLERAWDLAGSTPEAADDAAGGSVSAVLAVAEASGAPTAATLERLAGLLRERAAQRRALEAALAGPRATARLVALLPLVGLGFGAALGLDIVAAALGGGLGTWSMLLGALLLGVAWWWSRRIVAAAARGPSAPGLPLDLVAVALAGGGSAAAARRSAAAALEGAEVDPADWTAVDGALGLAERAGVPVRGLLLAEATAARTRARLEAEARAQRAGVRLALPLGVCVLPAFTLLAIVPLVVSMLQASLAPLG